MITPVRFAAIDGRPVARLVADLVGRTVSGKLTEPIVDLTEPSLPSLDELEAVHRQRLPYVEQTLAPVDVVIDGSSQVAIALTTSNYARYAAAAEVVRAFDVEHWMQLETSCRLGTPVQLSHSLGVNCTLETADGKLIWTKRSSLTNVESNSYNVAVSEGATPDDLDNGLWYPEATVRRALLEELGIPKHTPLEISSHSLISQIDNGGISLLAHVTTPLDSQEVSWLAVRADDRIERAEDPFCTEATAEGIDAMLAATIDTSWTSWGVASILGLMKLRFGNGAVSRLSWLEQPVLLSA
jgi:hypothetical protein